MQAPLPTADLTRPNRLIGEEPPQVLAHRLGRMVARLRVLFDRLQDDRLQVARDPGIEFSGTLRLGGLDLFNQPKSVGGVECRPQRQELVECDAQRIHVGASVSFAPKSLGGHVADRTENIAGLREAVIVALRQAEVRDPDDAFDVEKQVRRLDVAVHDAPRVGISETRSDLPRNLSQAAEKNSPSQLDGRELGPTGQRRRPRRAPCRPRSRGWQRRLRPIGPVVSQAAAPPVSVPADAGRTVAGMSRARSAPSPRQSQDRRSH